MDTTQQTATSATSKGEGQNSGVPYPVDTINNVLRSMKLVIDEVGTAKPISKEEIARILQKSVNTLTLFYSALSQYGIFALVHGKGYQPTSLYQKYAHPTEDNGEDKAKLQMFKSPPLYVKIIENLNTHTLPADEKRFANQLKEEPFNVYANSADRAAKIFFQNCRDLRLLQQGNVLSVPATLHAEKHTATGKGPDSEQRDNPPPVDNDNHTLPIQLGGSRKASLTYPVKLTRKDVRIIAKALEFIATSIEGENESEIEIMVQDKK